MCSTAFRRCLLVFPVIYSEIDKYLLTLSSGKESRAEIQEDPHSATISFRQLCSCCSSEELLSYYEIQRYRDWYFNTAYEYNNASS